MERRHDLDWVRVCAFGLLVLFHVGMYYVSWDWHIKSPHAGTGAEPFMLLTSPWRLSLLFLVSGVASAFLLQKMPKGFLGSRSWRLLLPLAFGMIVVVPPQAYFELLDSGYPGGYHDGYLAFWGRYMAADGSFCDDDGCLIVPTWNHLWFVAYLWVYTLALWLLARFAPKWLEAAGGRLSMALSGTGALLWPILFFAAVRVALIGRFEPTHALIDDWYNHVQYFGIFLLGFLIARTEAVWEAIQRQRWTAFALWLGSWLATVAYFDHFVEIAPPEWMRLAMRGAWGLNQWCAIVAVLGFARRWSPGDSRLLRYLVPAVFPVYILHQTLIVLLAWNFRPLRLVPAIEGPVLVVLTFALCFAAYELVRRVRLLRPLFGLKGTPRDAVLPGPGVTRQPAG